MQKMWKKMERKTTRPAKRTADRKARQITKKTRPAKRRAQTAKKMENINTPEARLDFNGPKLRITTNGSNPKHYTSNKEMREIAVDFLFYMTGGKYTSKRKYRELFNEFMTEREKYGPNS